MRPKRRSYKPGWPVKTSPAGPVRLDAVAGEAKRLGVEAAAIAVDVANADSVRDLFRQARALLGPIDTLVNGAGIAASAPLERTDDDLWRSILETNLSGTFYGLREALPEMAGRGWGRVVNVASIAGKTGYAYIGAYAASSRGFSWRAGGRPGGVSPGPQSSTLRPLDMKTIRVMMVMKGGEG